MNDGLVKPGDNLGALVAEAAQRHGDRPYLLWRDRQVSFAELDRRSGQYARGLAELGVRKGDRVAVMLENCPEYLFVWFGTAKLGAIEVSVNTAFKGAILQYILQDCGATVVVTSSQWMESLLPELASLPDLQTVVTVGEDCVPAILGRRVIAASSFDSLQPLEPHASPVDIAVLGYTSGTTGPSKGAMLTHNRIVKTGEEMAKVRGVTTDDNLYTCLPLFHGNAKFLTIMPALVTGARSSLGLRFSASQFWAEVKALGATQFNYLGVMISVLFKQPRSEADRAHSLKLGWGAGAMRDMLPAFEERFGVFLMEGYGLTEGGIPLSNTRNERRVGSCGKPMPGYEVDVVDDWDNPVPPGQQGELVLRSRWPHTTMAGYYGMPDKTAEIYRNFWLHTGDLASKDADGFFYFVDRKKDAIRRRGENISSFEVEAAVNSHPGILESAAFPIKSDVTEDDVMVVAVMKPGERLTHEAFTEHCIARMPYFWVPRFVRLTTQPLPRTPTNKVEKYRLREQGVTPDTWDREKAGYKASRSQRA